MWKSVFRFELRYQLGQPLFGLSALTFFLLAVGLGSSDVGAALGDTPGTALRNAPIVVLRLMPVLSLLGLFVVTAFVASAALRDFEGRSDALFFAKPLGRFDYLAGRFAGSMAVSLLVLLAAVAGLAAAALAPWQPADRLGDFMPAAYVLGLAVIVVPNLLTMGALFFALAVWSRRPGWTYLAAVFFIGLQDAMEVLAEGLDDRLIGGLIEPSGIVALETVSRYWTVAEQATRLPEVGGVLLANRLLWLTLALAVLALSFARFRFAPRQRRSGRARPEPGSAPVPVPVLAATGGVSTSPRPPRPERPPRLLRVRQLFGQARLEAGQVLFGVPFLMLLAFGLMVVVAVALTAGSYEGMPSLPLTELMLQAVGAGVRMTLVAILVLYAGELVFHQRTLKLSQVYDALPVSSGLLLASKLLALAGVTGVFLLLASLSTAAVQLARGQVPDPLLYAQGLAVLALPLVPVVVLAVCLQVLADRKLLGLLLTVLALALRFALPPLGLENVLYRYGGHPPIAYSGLNGYGHQAWPFVASMAYWAFGAVILGLVTLLFWPRGTVAPWADRWAVARRRLSRPVAGALVAGAVGMTAVGAWIFHQTAVRSDYLDRDRITRQLADYERLYRRYAEVPLPRVTAVVAQVDLYPYRRQVLIRGRYRLENRGDEPVRTLPITRSPRWVEGVLPVYGGVHLERLDLPGRRLLADDRLGFYVYELDRPLLPGQAVDLEFTVGVDHGGFGHGRHNDLVVANGIFFSNRNFFPFVGYARGHQLLDPVRRRRHGLPPPQRAADLDDPSAVDRNYLAADWIRFEATVSTAADQVAVAPGDLVRQWREGDRRFFHYRASKPIVNLFTIHSGRYRVARDRWRDVDLEVYFHPRHHHNIGHFLDTARRSLEHLDERLGPYPHGQLRIVEVPSYHGQTAFSLAQTIAFSESWGFAADLQRAELDWLAAVLSHEVAHQWWNHQVVPADVQGATLIAEALPQLAALGVLEELHGADAVDRFLRAQRDRYLDGRGHERLRELPLARVENQDYVHYAKGTLALAALRRRAGAAAVDDALRHFLLDHAFGGPPYATSRHLLQHLRRSIPAEHHGLIAELFETVTLYDHRLTGGSFAELADGRFEVRLHTRSAKLRDDGHGVLTEVPMDDWLEVAVYGEPTADAAGGPLLALDRSRPGSAPHSFTLVVDERPARAVLDPHHLHVDRQSADNTRELVRRSGEPARVGRGEP